MKKNLGIILIASLLLVLVFRSMPQEKPLDTTETFIKRKVYIGAWVGGFWEDEERKLDISSLKTFEKNIGTKVALANIYTDWTYLANSDLLKSLDEISENGWTPMISSNPKFFESCPQTNRSLYATIASGDCDDFLKSIAANLKKYNKPIFLRFAWEMNLPSIYWSVPFLKSTPEEFKNAWRQFYTVLKNENVTNVIWILSFNTSSSKTIPYADLYPGDDYVDWVAVDGYNWGTSVTWSGWTSFNNVFKRSYDELTSITDKPLMISEVNSSPDGGNKAEWLKDMLTVQIVQNYPRVKSVIFFNEEKLAGESVDWRLEKSPEYLFEVQNGLRNEIYQSTYP